jgi:TonB-linked SusC/RagA family outer membrane protein
MRNRFGFLAAAVWLCFAVTSAEAQQRRVVTGRVIDEATGQPVGGAQITIRGTNTGTLGRADGTFAVSVPNQPVVLQVTFIGYRRAEVNVSPTTNTVDVRLGVDVLNVDEIVVTGQATGISRRNLANSVAKVNAEELVKAPTASVEQSLQGKLAGAQISINNGAPGGGANVRLRGVSTIIGAYTPLYVVDGVVVSDATIFTGVNFLKAADRAAGIAGNQDNPVNRIADLNPNDIESIEVLKGAAASAIYGSKASNGVILITTKRGRAGAALFSFSQKFGVAKASKYFGARTYTSADEVLNALGPAAVPIYQAANGQTFDNERELIGHTPLSYETGANVSGGTDNTRYFASGLIKHDGGVVGKTFADKQSLRLNLDQTIGTKLNLNLSSEVIHVANDRGLFGNENNGTSYYSQLAGTPNFVDLRKRADGTYPPVAPFGTNNVLQTADLFENRETVWRSLFNLKADYLAFTSDQNSLRLIFVGGGDVFTQKNAIFSPAELFWEADDGFLGTSITSFSQSQNFNINANAVYRFNGASFTATTQLGGQFEANDQNITRAMARNLVGGLNNIRSGTSFLNEQDRQRIKDLGFFGQEELLLLNERLLLTLGLRGDQSSNNGDPNQLFYYPKASASFRIPMQRMGVDEFKLRAAFGQAGNRPKYGQKFTELEPGNIIGVPSARIRGETGSNELRPERQREIELGLDGTFAGGFGNVEISVYEKKVDELLLTRTLAPTTGFGQQFFNGGTVRNRGLEVATTLLPIRGDNFTWTSRFTFSMNRCKVTELPVPAFRPISFLNGNTFGSTFIEEGKSCTQIHGFYKDDAGVRQVGHIADQNPRYRGSLSNDFNIGRLRLYALVDHQKDGLLLNGTQLLFDLNGNAEDHTAEKHSGYGTGAERGATFGQETKGYLENTTFWKLREASVMIDVPQNFARSLIGTARHMRVGLTGRNLAMISPYRGHDPEGTQISRSLAEGISWELSEYPPSRSFWLTVDFGF